MEKKTANVPILPYEIVENILLLQSNDDPISAFKNINSLNNFFRNSLVRCKIINKVKNFDLLTATEKDNIQVLQWRWSIRNRKTLEFDREKVIIHATKMNRIKVLEWMKNNNIPLRTKISILKIANNVTYDWWKYNSGQMLVY